MKQTRSVSKRKKGRKETRPREQESQGHCGEPGMAPVSAWPLRSHRLLPVTGMGGSKPGGRPASLSPDHPEASSDPHPKKQPGRGSPWKDASFPGSHMLQGA